MFLAKNGDPQASWRQVKVVQNAIAYDRLRRINVDYATSPGRRESYEEEIEFDDGMLLGEIFDKLAEIAQRSPSEHELAKQRVFFLRKERLLELDRISES